MIYLRLATDNDIKLLYDWANDPVVRNNSFNSEPIPYDTHQKWFNRMMDDENVLQYILMDCEMPVGQIRLTVNGEEAEIGYSIASEYRAKGYGHKILQLIVREVRVHHPEIKKLLAKVKPDNQASNRLFENENFVMDYFCYGLDICEDYDATGL